MTIGLLGALAAALCYGTASVLQAVGARRTASAEKLDPRLLLRLARQTPFVIGVALDTVGFLLSLVALRTLPLFVVQAAVAANVAVTAVLAVAALGARLQGRDWAAVLAVCAGLALLGLSAGAEGAPGGHLGVRAGLLVAALLLVGVAVTALAARSLVRFSLTGLLADPATYALLLSGLTAFLTYATALQRGAVTTVTATIALVETVLPAVAGVLLLGDRTRPGFAWVAVGGFVLALAGSVSLARFGEVTPHDVTRSMNADAAVHS